jgi:probable HAF family extracellular repeat protein
MVTSVRWKWYLLPILGIALLAGGLVVRVEGGKPKPPPPPPSPPVLYDIQFWTTPPAYPGFYLNKMNNLGQVVGWCSDNNTGRHGFLYDPWTDPDCAVDLNTLPITNIPNGWVIASAVGINDQGVIVGYLRPTDPSITTLRKGYILDTTATTLQLEFLPGPEPSSYWGCYRINNSGDVLVYYKDDTTGAGGARMYKRGATDWGPDAGVNATCIDLSNNEQVQVALQVADGTSYGLACRWTPSTGTLEWIPSGGWGSVVVAYGINDAGTVCGWTGAQAPKGGPGQYPFRYTDSLEVLFDAGSGLTPQAINSESDLLCWKGGNKAKDYVYQDTLGSSYDLECLIDPSDPDAAIWSSKSGPAGVVDMNNRIGTTGFGQIMGKIFFADGSQLGFLLTPETP